MRLIDADKLMRDVEEYDLSDGKFQHWIEIQPTIEPEQHWISCSDRLPDDGQEILFSTKTGCVRIGIYYDDGSARQWYSFRDRVSAWNNVVNAWMPISAPEPYKGE